jgi:alpha-galactosidase
MLRSGIVLIGLTFCSASLSAAGRDDLAGSWTTEITKSTPEAQVLIFGRRDGLWTGTMTTRFGTMELRDVAFEGGQVAFSEVFDVGLGPVAPIRVHGVLRRGELRLRVPAAAGFTDRVAHRANVPAAVTIEAASARTVALTGLPDNGLARTPPMGWNSWNHFQSKIDDKTVRETADALVASGLRDVGYLYVNIDDTWEGERDGNGLLRPNSKFPDMRALADYIHSRGLKLGLYSSPGPRTCADYEGSYGHEEQDAKTFAAWGVDYLKYDWCSADAIYSTPAEMQAAYLKMGAALQATGRPIVYSLCQYGLFDVGEWASKVGGNLWRTTGDIQDYWASMEEIGFAQHRTAGPGRWNDPDMLELGNGGMSEEEYRTHITLWSMLSAPLLLGNDIRHMTPWLKELLTNKDVIAIDQDRLGMPGRRLSQAGTEIWSKALYDGSIAVAMFNRGREPAEMQVSWSDLDLPYVRTVRDVWRKLDQSPKPEGYRATVPPHGVILLRLDSRSSSQLSEADAAAPDKTVNILFIGDSITAGLSEEEAPPVSSAAWLRQHGPGKMVFAANLGRGGHTTVDVSPDTGTDFVEIEHAATQLQSTHPGRLVFSVMLGTNDSAVYGPLGSPVSSEQYRKNLVTILDRLLKDYPGCSVILHRPIWYSPNTYNGSRYLAEGLQRLESYFPEIDTILAHYQKTRPNHVFRGDTKSFEFFKENHKLYMTPEQGEQGTFYLHPNKQGAELLGRFWAEAIEASMSMN